MAALSRSVSGKATTASRLDLMTQQDISTAANRDAARRADAASTVLRRSAMTLIVFRERCVIDHARRHAQRHATGTIGLAA